MLARGIGALALCLAVRYLPSPGVALRWARVGPELPANATVRNPGRHELRHPLHRPYFSGVDVALGVSGHSFTHRPAAAHAGCSRRGVLRDEIPDLSRPGATDPKTLSPAGIVVGAGLRIDRVEHVVVVDEEPTDPAELIPGVKVIPLLIEDLDPPIAPVGHEQPSLRVHRERVRSAELAIPVTPLAETHDEGPVRSELGDTALRIRSR